MASDKMQLLSDKLLQAFDDASVKRRQTRINAYVVMCEIWTHYYIPDSLTNRKMVLMASLENSLKKGEEKEQNWAGKVIPLMVIQSETVEDVVEILQLLKPALMSIVRDSSAANCNVCAQCCTVLGMLYFAGEKDPHEILVLMKILQGILQISTPDSENGEHYAKVLNCWSLLLTLLTPESIVEQITNAVLLSVSYLIGMLESKDLAVRTVIGKTLALMYELGLQHNTNFLQDELPDVIDTIQKLLTDVNRSQAKEHRKLQRFIFRDVLHYLQEHKIPAVRIKFADETLLLDSWAIHHQYSCLRNVFGAGMNVHLKENVLIRYMLKLGPKRDTMEKHSVKVMKMEQQLSNVIMAKKRAIARGKDRDKRSYVLE
uniref:Interferon-related developmental regulator N-terminal domain-containing protein n=1 Tax=Anopheles minimus TaxID=112268 RepID=A0A182W9B9_9DIPT